MKTMYFALLVGTCVSVAACASPTQKEAESTGPTIIQTDFFRPADISDNRLKGVRFIGKTVSDIDQTIEFYQQAVPFDVVSRYKINAADVYPPELMSGEFGEVEVATIKTPTVYIKLTDFDPETQEAPYNKPVNAPGYTHICFQSPATDPAYGKFRKAGLNMITQGDGPVDLGGYGVTYAYGRDPDGTMIESEILDRPRRTESAWVSHIGGATSDVDAMAEFYTKIVGYGPRRRGEYSNNPRMDAIANLDGMSLRSAWFVTRNLDLEIWQYVEPATVPRDVPANVDQIGYNMTAFEVTDVEAERQRLEELGVDFVGEAKESRGWKIYYAYDPDGNVISIQENISAPKSESIDDLQWVDPTTH